MTLFDKISEDIKQAMLDKNKVALDALRGVKKEFLEAKTAKVVMASCTMTRRYRYYKKW